MTIGDTGRAFLGSALPGPSATPDPEAFLAERSRAHLFEAREVPLSELSRWRLGDDLAHETRRFFSIEGLSVETNFGPVRRWTQPIIMQPEIGALGFLARRIDGRLHLLAQAKMEPGNRIMVQFSPTVQATPSNYTRVHGGRPTPYLEHFLGPGRGRVLVDQLQSEQGTRYYRKRNRNLVIELPDDREVPVASDFAWLTLAQIRTLLAAGNRVNMNARTVLSCISYDGEPDGDDSFAGAVRASHLANGDDEELQATLSWLADVKTELHLDARRIRLGELEQWICDGESIRHVSGRFFRVVGIAVTAGSREVGAWKQPMLAPAAEGHALLVAQRREGVLCFLVQARVEPGFIDRVELGPTVQVSLHPAVHKADLPRFADLLEAPASWVRLDAPQSEDGGRFYRQDTRHRVVEVPEDEPLDAPPTYRWMTLGAMKRLMRRGYTIDVELRSLMACLG